MKNKKDMIKWRNNLKSDIGQPQHSQLWHYTEILDVIARYLESTERPKGEWIKVPDRETVYACDQCGCEPYYFKNINTIKFCPNCGADMRGDKEC